MQDDIKERNREIEEGVFKATNDPKRPLLSPAAEAVPPHLNFAPMENAADVLNRSAADYRKALEQANASGGAALASASLTEVNKMLIESGAQANQCRGTPQSPVVQTPALCSRLLHWIWRQDGSGCARSH